MPRGNGRVIAALAISSKVSDVAAAPSAPAPVALKNCRRVIVSMNCLLCTHDILG